MKGGLIKLYLRNEAPSSFKVNAYVTCEVVMQQL